MKKNLNELISKSQNGDQVAYQEFLIESDQFIKSRIKKWIKRTEIQEEISQEVLFGIHKNLHTFRAELSAYSWIASIAHYKVIDYFRKNKHLMNEIEWDVTIEDQKSNIYSKEEEAERIDELFLKLNPLSRQAILKTKIEGLSTKEAAKELGIKENALRTKISRGMSFLKNSLK